jgi:DUF1680 family protein
MSRRVPGLLILLLAAACGRAAEPAPAWPAVTLPSPREVELGGAPGSDLRRGLERLTQAPYEAPWVLADVSFGVKRIFTNYSGDVSGRFIELAALTSPRERLAPPALEAVLRDLLRYQKPDGHFGADFDLSKRFERDTTQKTAPLPMFWGNGRILVGLIEVARELNKPEFLEAAKRLGDYYVNGGDLMCSPAREAEYRATGTYGDSYVCDYFPAIEGLAILYRVTKDERYLKHAQRMAESFRKFDQLPIEHSHGNLCGWRGMLMLYEITKERPYLDAARAKWDAAVGGGFIWPIGGLGEHWHVSYGITEACSESDWLRFDLELWRFTGETRYLEMAERVLQNQYRLNQCGNGGFGSRHLDQDAAGPVAVQPKIDEWYFCCSFHGPLGLHYLKAYLAAGSERGVYVNFPVEFSAPVQASGRVGRVVVATRNDPRTGNQFVEVELAPKDRAEPWRTVLNLRVPENTALEEARVGDEVLRPALDGGWLRLEREFRAGEKLVATLRPTLTVEGRRFQKLRAEPGKVSILRDAAVLSGPLVLFAPSAPPAKRPTLLATLDAQGRLSFPTAAEGGFLTVALPSTEGDAEKLGAALDSAPVVALRPWGAFPLKRRTPFMFDVVVVPAETLDAKRLEAFAARAREGAAGTPVFGADLEKRRELWPGLDGWTFSPAGLRVAGGETGLIQSEGYRDYRFSFDLVMPAEGQGLAGWLVRARDTEHAVMFQLQSADSPFHAPEYKTKPNTLRPHFRRDGQWQILDPVPLPKDVKRGETHAVAVECRGETIEVFLDGAKIHTLRAPEYGEGGVGFRAGSPAEQGLFSRIELRKL